MKNKFNLVWALSAGFVLLFIIALMVINSRQRVSATTFDPPRQLASASIPLVTAAGPLQISSLQGKLVLLSIGYTNCPNFCPTTLANLRRALELLEPDQAQQVQVLFISVDPGQDSPEKLAAYTAAFNPSFIGAVAPSTAELDQLVKEIGGYYQLGTPDENGYYTVEHSTNTMILKRDGSMAAFWGYGTEPSVIAADLRLLLRQK